MDYKPISQRDSDSPVASQAEGCDLYKSKRKSAMFTTVLLSLSTATFVLLLILLGLSVSRKSIYYDVPNHISTVSTRYGHNTSRMSLDHKYDFLWNDFHQDGFGDVHIEGAINEEDRFVGISM